MAALCDSIEQFILKMLDEFGDSIELQRNDMADYFRCAPSQITYVITTRFSPERGYITESRRGGGGCVKINKIDPNSSGQLLEIIKEKLTDGNIGEKDALSIISGLLTTGIIEKRESELMRAAVSDRAVNVPAMRDNVRANILKEMLIALLSKEE